MVGSLREIYEQLLPNPDNEIESLFSGAFSTTLQNTSARVAAEYRVTEDEAIEEFRRLLAIKAFTSDVKASKISPTPLSKEASKQPHARNMC